MTVTFQTYVVVAPVIRTEVTLSVVLRPPVEATVVDELAQLVDCVLATADRGAFVEAAATPASASVRVKQIQPLGSGQQWVCDMRAIDHRVAQVIRNVLVMFTQVVHPVQSFQMVAAGGAAPARSILPLGTISTEHAYPPLSNVLLFRTQVDTGLDARGQRLVRITFARPIPDAELQTVLAWLEDWGVAVQGGYAEDEETLESGDCAIFDAMPDIDDDRTIEMPILRMGAPAVAWNSLLNLCGRMDTEIAKVAEVQIT